MSIGTIMDTNYQVMYCTTTMTAFGPVFDISEDVEAFCEWLEVDPRSITSRELAAKVCEWRNDVIIAGMLEGADF